MASGGDQRRFRDVQVDLAKLRGYCLSATHPRGRHKARVFLARLGLTDSDAEWLQAALLTAASDRQGELQATVADSFGQRYQLDINLDFAGRKATVRSAWMVLAGDEVLRLTTCYVL